MTNTSDLEYAAQTTRAAVDEARLLRQQVEVLKEELCHRQQVESLVTHWADGSSACTLSDDRCGTIAITTCAVCLQEHRMLLTQERDEARAALAHMRDLMSALTLGDGGREAFPATEADDDGEPGRCPSIDPIDGPGGEA